MIYVLLLLKGLGVISELEKNIVFLEKKVFRF